MRVINWNVQWVGPRSKRGLLILEEIFKRTPEVVCVTEGYEEFFSNEGFTISSNADYGYNSNPDRRKVLLWSKNPWKQIDDFGDINLPSGRFISGKTMTSIGEVEFVGVCIPWRDAHVSTGRKNRRMWEDHKAYLKGLKLILSYINKSPRILLGDFNQRIPRAKQPIHIYELLLNSFPDKLHFATSGNVPGLDKQTIDHIAHSIEIIAKNIFSIDNKINDEKLLSDHFGVVVDLENKK
ncbi:MAG: endonuclease/exonuclease/phosphatase family protein [Bacteroidetes bacterium]|nr:endonuclease/exonuclease/phosphatase family protein [Bacteroidota bacterium]